MWWKHSINKRVNYIDQNYHNHLMSICKKVLFTYPPVPLELSDLYNIVLYKVAQNIKDFKYEIDINIYILSKSKGYAKNECRRFLTKKHKILNNFIPLNDQACKTSDVIKQVPKIDISCFSFIEKKIFTMFFLDNNSKIYIKEKTSLTRRELDKVINNIKFKVKKQHKVYNEYFL